MLPETSEALRPARRTAVRCAIYTRKSTEEGLEQDFNTLDAQRESAESFIRSQTHEGWRVLPEHYDDGGFTGANMDRPALKRLLEDIKAGLINCVVVYKVDRLTRSLLDFSRIIEVLDKHGASFVSVTQQFNTTSSLGRLTLHILLSFAQFEREMIAERTQDKMSAARRKGKWVGGNPVLGYDVTPQGGSLMVNEAEAERVRAIFDLYLELGSLIPVIQELDHRGWTLKEWTTRKGVRAGGTQFAKNTLYSLLTNVIYIGKVNYRGQLYDGEQPQVVETETWKRVQATLKANGRIGGYEVRNKYGAILKGIVRCASCDAGMIHTYTKKTANKLYRYYVCVTAHQRGWNKCATKAVSAPAIEEAVVAQIRGIGSHPTMVDAVVGSLEGDRLSEYAELEHEKRVAERELRRLNDEMAGLVSTAASKGQSMKLATDRLADLQDRSAALERRLNGVKKQLGAQVSEAVDREHVAMTLRNFDSLWQQMSPREQEKLVKALVERVTYDGRTGAVTIGFRSAVLKQMCAPTA
ncbi:MAG: recombinase family protein [Acidobacteriia bacterium]|nr:recombinase family protein [Terriglobia bacterium]